MRWFTELDEVVQMAIIAMIILMIGHIYSAVEHQQCLETFKSKPAEEILKLC